MKNKIKILILFVICLCVCISLLSCSLIDRLRAKNDGGDDGSRGVHLTEVKGGYCVDSIGKCTDTKIVIPASFKGKPVVSIDTLAFEGVDFIEEVVIPDSVKSIGDFAFTNCTSLRKVTLPGTIELVGDSAFSNCHQDLYSEYANAKYVGSEENPYLVLVEPKNDYIESVRVHDDTKVISSFALSFCTRLQGIVIGKNVTHICAAAFYGSSGMREIKIPQNVTYIGLAAFGNCDILKFIVNPDNRSYKAIDGSLYTYDGSTLVKYANDRSETKFIIPSNVTVIGDDAFSFSRYLEYVTLPNGLKHIGFEAFYGCARLTSVIIPASVTTIEDGAFAYCRSLISILVESQNTNYVSYEGSLYTYDGERLVQYAIGIKKSSFTLPSKVKVIGHSAFSGSFYLSNVSLSIGLEVIDDYAFCNCDKLRSISIPHGVKLIGMYAFSECDLLTQINLPGTLTRIELGAFSSLPKLSKIIYNSTVDNWNSIEKIETWDEDSPNYVVYCSDGNISKNTSSST